MKRYVVGFAFTEDKGKVLLIQKKRPEWQAGYYNGIGGKIEENETPSQAMSREAQEEAAIDVEWLHRGVMTGKNNDGSEFECHIFCAYDDRVCGFRQMEDEPLKMMSYPLHPGTPVINNLDYLLPIGVCADGLSFIRMQY